MKAGPGNRLKSGRPGTISEAGDEGLFAGPPVPGRTGRLGFRQATMRQTRDTNNRRPNLRLVPPLSPGRAGARGTRTRDESEIREAKVALARRRVADGYYERDDVLETIADGILRFLRPTPETPRP
jgi:hypothetical protein